MFAELLRHEVAGRRWSGLALGVVVSAMAVFVFGVTAGLSQAITDLSDGLPKALTAFIGGGGGGYAIGELFNLIGPAALVGYAIVVGGSTIAGEEERGTMSIITAQPVTRSSIVAAKGLALLVILLGVTLLLWASVVVSSSGYGIRLDVAGLTAICVHLLALAIAFGAIAFAIGGTVGDPGIATGVGAALAVASYAANAMLPLAKLGDWAKLSPWYYFAGSDPLENGIDLTHLAVLLAIATVAAIISFVGFARRDLLG